MTPSLVRTTPTYAYKVKMVAERKNCFVSVLAIHKNWMQRYYEHCHNCPLTDIIICHFTMTLFTVTNRTDYTHLTALILLNCRWLKNKMPSRQRVNAAMMKNDTLNQRLTEVYKSRKQRTNSFTMSTKMFQQYSKRQYETKSEIKKEACKT